MTPCDTCCVFIILIQQYYAELNKDVGLPVAMGLHVASPWRQAISFGRGLGH